MFEVVGDFVLTTVYILEGAQVGDIVTNTMSNLTSESCIEKANEFIQQAKEHGGVQSANALCTYAVTHFQF